MHRFQYLIPILLVLLVGCSKDSEPPLVIHPVVATGSVAGDADECAIWVAPSNSARSTVIGNDKESDGALYVWELCTGREIFRTAPIDQPVGCAIRQGVKLGRKWYDLVGCGIRSTGHIRIYAVNQYSRRLCNMTVAGDIPTEIGDKLYGIAFYVRPYDGQLFAFVSAKEHGANIHQIALSLTCDGKITGRVVRKFGGSDQGSFVEGMTVDDQHGFLYCSDEEAAVLKYHADPCQGNELVARFATDDGIEGDREGIDLYRGPWWCGYLALSSQGNALVKIYTRDQNLFVKTIDAAGATHTDGLAVTSCRIGRRFPQGVLVCHSEESNNFLIYDWRDLKLEPILPPSRCGRFAGRGRRVVSSQPDTPCSSAKPNP